MVASIGQRVRVPKMAELVAADLRRQIIRGELKEGDALPPETALMEQYGVSRPTLREAFRVLEAESLILIQRGARGGGRVQTPNREVAARYAGLMLQYQGATLRDVFDARVLLEAPCAAALARRRTRADLHALHEALDEYDGVADDPEKAVRLHDEFHSMIVRLAGNQTLTLLSDILQDIVDQAHLSRAVADIGTPEQERVRRRTVKTHRRLVELIEARDADGAEALWRKHVIEAAEYTLHGDPKSTVLDLLR